MDLKAHPVPTPPTDVGTDEGSTKAGFCKPVQQSSLSFCFLASNTPPKMLFPSDVRAPQMPRAPGVTVATESPSHACICLELRDGEQPRTHAPEPVREKRRDWSDLI